MIVKKQPVLVGLDNSVEAGPACENQFTVQDFAGEAPLNERVGNSQTVVVWGGNLLAGLIRAALPQSGVNVLVSSDSPDIEPDALLLVDDTPALPAGINGYLKQARASYPNAPICVISECDYSHLVPQREQRVSSYVHPAVSHDALSHIVQVLIAGGEYVYRPPNGSGGAANGDPEAATLSARERQICELVKLSCSNKVIAQRLGLSNNTVKVHLRSAMGKLGAHTRVEVALRSQASAGRIEPWLRVNGHGAQ